MGPAGPSSKVFSLRPPGEAGATSGAIPVATRGALVLRIRERLSGGQSADSVLREEVNREVTAFLGRADPRIVERVTEDVRKDPALSEIFNRLVRHAGDEAAGPAAIR